jgi:hypothetical protein
MSSKFSNTSAAICLALGLVAGIVLAGFWPSMPLHAVATDKVDTFSMATGPCGDDVEAVYFFDHLTGDLYAYIVGRAVNGGIGPMGRYYHNVSDDFKANGEKAKYLMVTGLANLVRGGRTGTIQPAHAVVYIAELSTGTAVAYGMPYNAQAYRAGTPQPPAELTAVCQFEIRKPIGATKPTSGKKKGKDDLGG